MMSLGQKIIAIAMLVLIEGTFFLFFPLVAIIGLFFVIPMAVLIMKR